MAIIYPDFGLLLLCKIPMEPAQRWAGRLLLMFKKLAFVKQKMKQLNTKLPCSKIGPNNFRVGWLFSFLKTEITATVLPFGLPVLVTEAPLSSLHVAFAACVLLPLCLKNASNF